jgi:hypothetical protein
LGRNQAGRREKSKCGEEKVASLHDLLSVNDLLSVSGLDVQETRAVSHDGVTPQTLEVYNRGDSGRYEVISGKRSPRIHAEAGRR